MGGHFGVPHLINLQLRDLVQDAVDLTQDLAALLGEARHVLAEPFVLLTQPAQCFRGPAYRVLQLSQSLDNPVTHLSLARLGRRGPSPATSCGSQNYSPRHATWNRSLTPRATRS